MLNLLPHHRLPQIQVASKQKGEEDLQDQGKKGDKNRERDTDLVLLETEGKEGDVATDNTIDNLYLLYDNFYD